MITDVTIQAKRCTCNFCGHVWLSFAEEIPGWCANQKCRTRAWNGVKVLVQSHTNEIQLPSPRPRGRPRTMPGFGDDE